MVPEVRKWGYTMDDVGSFDNGVMTGEGARIRAQSLFEALAESAPDAIVTIDAESRILSANDAVRRIFGYDADEVIGKSLTMFMPEPLRARHEHGFSRYLRTGQKGIPWTGVQLAGLTRDGREIPIEISFGEFVDRDGRRIFSGFVRDISDRFRRQRELEKALDDLRFQAHLLSSVEQAIISMDREGTILTWNEYAETLFGWSATEAVGQRLHDLLPPVEDDAGSPAAYRRAGEDKKMAFERQVRRRDGRTIWVSVISAPVRDAGGSVTRIVRTYDDITERRRLEEQFLQAQKMDAVGRLAGGLAHDFNNLLTVITAHSEFLASALPARSEAMVDVAQISDAANRAAALTRQLLTFSRQQRMEQKALDVNQLIGNLEKMLARLTGEHIELEFDLGSDVQPVLADAGQLEQAIVSLVVNARDAMPSGGLLRVITRRVSVEAGSSGRPSGRYAAITVVDHGHGMTDEVRSQIFEPFFTTKEAGKGTGLGLATVYGIVKQARGFVDVESAPGTGATFTVYLPETRREASAAPEGRPGGECVLLVEDQDEVRKVAVRILSGSGYRVIEARDGAEALTVLADGSRQVDVVLTDAVMPRVNGPELMREARKRIPGLPFVIMSGYTADEGVAGTAEDAVIFVQKPFKRERLLAAVREALDAARAGE